MNFPDFIAKKVKEFREGYCEMERAADEHLKHKCNYEQKTRPVVAKEYGVPSFEENYTRAITEAYLLGLRRAQEIAKEQGRMVVRVDFLVAAIRKEIDGTV